MDWKGIPITDGTGQQDRKLAALVADYFNVDELSFEELLAMGAKFAKAMNFYNLNNDIDGNWGEMFNADEAVVMADIISTDIKRLESDFQRIPFSDTAKLLNFMLEQADKIDFWFTRLSACQHESGKLLAQKIATLIEDKLGIELRNLYAIARLAEIQSLSIKESEFAPVWKLATDANASSGPLSRPPITKLPDNGELKNQLSASFYIFPNAISYLESTAKTCLEQSLDSGQHDPSIALFMVFLKIYKKAQQHLNRFTLRHLDFYYRQVLKLGNRQQIPNSYYLLLETQTGTGRVQVEEATEFSAGKDAQLNEIIYSADEVLSVSDARIESLASLYLQRDPLISPESDVGFVTRIKSEQPPVSAPGADQTLERPISWPLFGAEQTGGEKGSSKDAGIGFSIASAILQMAQGTRRIDLTIELEPVAKADLDTQISALKKCKSQPEFSEQFSRLFARYLLSFKGCLRPEQKDRIVATAKAIAKTEVEAKTEAEATAAKSFADEIESLLNEDWQWLFYKLFKKVFVIKLTTETGWLEVSDYYLQPLPLEGQPQKAGLQITIGLSQEAEPITAYNAEVHGGQLHTELPVLQCLINPKSNFYPYSVFKDLVIASLKIDVDVSGVKNLLVYNQHGQLDSTKPFQPFGPLPSSSSYFVFGNYEMARKRLQQVRLSLDWAELPRAAGGFEQHYSGYKTAYRNDSFQVRISSLADSHWMPDDAAMRPCSRLFQTTTGNRVATQMVVKIDQLDYARPIDPRITESDYQYDLTARKGFFRLSLSAPDSAFGHGEHGQLLTEVISANVKLKKPKPVPNQAYTPTLDGVSLAYRASSTIIPSVTADGVSRQSDKVSHIHPFGIETVFPPVLDRPCFLLPQYEHEGNLFIGLSGNHIPGTLSLLFHLSKNLAQSAHATHETFDWFYLADNSWKKLTLNQILSDTTHGFLAPGKVMLNIPADISNDNSVMPGNRYWLRVSVRRGASAFTSCYSIQPHALKVSRKQDDLEQPVATDPGLVMSWSALNALPGIASIRQAYNAFGGRSAESNDEFKVRVAERLRHKNRALTPWDYEQLILEAFPNIIKVKCFNSISSIEDRLKPGNVLIVVVPDVKHAADVSCAHEMINARQLHEIREHVKKLCSTFVSLEVRNPQYEQVQVRCTIKFDDAASPGLSLNRLNREISDYICPWKPGGYLARFGWSIRQQDIESHILDLDYVEAVTNFSMLHITVDSAGSYSLADTARGGPNHEAIVKPRYPWSLAIPMENHFIETMQTARTITAEVTGVDELAVGSTFIIVGNSENGEEE